LAVVLSGSFTLSSHLESKIGSEKMNQP